MIINFEDKGLDFVLDTKDLDDVLELHNKFCEIEADVYDNSIFLDLKKDIDSSSYTYILLTVFKKYKEYVIGEIERFKRDYNYSCKEYVFQSDTDSTEIHETYSQLDEGLDKGKITYIDDFPGYYWHDFNDCSGLLYDSKGKTLFEYDLTTHEFVFSPGRGYCFDADMTLEEYKKYCYEWLKKNYCSYPVPDCCSCIADYYCDATYRNCIEGGRF